MNTIICPHCKKPVEISEALKHQIEDQMLSEVNEKHKLELEEARLKAQQESSRKLQEQFELQMKQMREDAYEKDQRNKELLDRLEKMMEESRQLKREKDEARLEMQKKLAEEEEKIRLEASKKAEEEQHSKVVELLKQIEDAKKANTDLQRKLDQGSQQLQGEAFELEFEEMLKKHYPNDNILPVGKGIRGGDVVQEVCDRNGNVVGKILWELKNTKTWSEPWVDKLKGDQRVENAEEAVIITEAMPTNIQTTGFRNGVWVTQRNYVIPLATALRINLNEIYKVKNSVKMKDQKMEILYNYLAGTEFRHRVEAIIDAFTNMQTEIEKEKRYFANKWARDEKNIRQVIDSTYGMHGDLKGIIGNALAQVRGIDLLLEDGN